MPADSAVLLIGGVSHTGKSTLADAVANELNWRKLSTDQLARHPGRPWRDDGSSLPDDVVAHYQTLSPEQLAGEVLSHYHANVWPVVNALVHSHRNNPFDPPLVFEGSAILPDRVAEIAEKRVQAVFLHGEEVFLRDRIYRSSGYEQNSAINQQLIDAFLDRALLLNERLYALASAAGLRIHDAADPTLFEQLLLLAADIADVK